MALEKMTRCVPAFLWAALIAGTIVAQTDRPIANFDNLPAPTGERIAEKRIELTQTQKLWIRQRGSQLTERLRQLQRIESTLGRRHPSMPEVQSELASVRSQLAVFGATLDSPSMDNPGVDPSVVDVYPELEPDELRMLLLQMAIKMDRLETRIGVLERRQRQS